MQFLHKHKADLTEAEGVSRECPMSGPWPWHQVMVARSVDTDWALVTERPGTGAGDWAATAETGETKHEWGDRGDKERALVFSINTIWEKTES